MRKAPYMKMKEYMAWVEELKNCFMMFPGYQVTMELQYHKLLDIYKFGVPVLLQKHFPWASRRSDRSGHFWLRDRTLTFKPTSSQRRFASRPFSMVKDFVRGSPSSFTSMS